MRCASDLISITAHFHDNGASILEEFASMRSSWVQLQGKNRAIWVDIRAPIPTMSTLLIYW